MKRWTFAPNCSSEKILSVSHNSMVWYSDSNFITVMKILQKEMYLRNPWEPPLVWNTDCESRALVWWHYSLAVTHLFVSFNHYWCIRSLITWSETTHTSIIAAPASLQWTHWIWAAVASHSADRLKNYLRSWPLWPKSAVRSSAVIGNSIIIVHPQLMEA